jgi:hypothetical protein
MYLTHNTRLEYLKSILNDGELKSASKSRNLHEGEGVYKPYQQHFVFFSTTPNLFDPEIATTVTLYFNLPQRKRTMYIANVHAANPTKLAEWRTLKGMKYLRKIPANVSDVERQKQLMDLYKNSINSPLKGKFFYAFHQVAIKNNFSLKNLAAISFYTSDKHVYKLIEKIKTEYPNIQIKLQF